jgi:FtsP/CotA-like multicopper oxidase with cupredoxin domain
MAGQKVSLLTYNGRFPGPLLRAPGGGLLRVELVNHLDEPTNLHFHGLHVSPGGNGDNVFVSVPPGRRFLYELALPEGHGGTFWYHPHAHHRLARQLWRGLAGPLIVDRAGDRELGLAVADEQVLVVKDLTILDGRPAPHVTADWARGKSGSVVLVNGRERPSIAARAGTVRVRLINACNGRALLLARADGRPLAVIAHDGHLLEAAQSLPEVLVTPAQRVDLMVTFEEAQPVQLVHRPYNRGARREPPREEELLTLRPPAEAPVAVSDRPGKVERLDPSAVARRRRLTMAMAFLHAEGGSHLEPIRTRLGDLEAWEITNVDTQDHVFNSTLGPSRSGASMRRYRPIRRGATPSTCGPDNRWRS